jgi:hypothetical protein
MIFPTVTLAQQSTYVQMVNRITNIDNEIKILTYKKEAIGLKFKEISDFSMQARPILAGYNEIVEAINSKDNERSWYSFTLSEHKILKTTWYKEYQSLINKKDNYLKQFRNSGGVISPSWVHCNTIEVLQNEYNKTVINYQDKKKDYDNIAVKLGNLNNEKQNLTAELNYMGASFGQTYDLSGCWLLRTGRYTSTITVTTTDQKEFIGRLTVNNLHNYLDGQIMFRVTRVSPDTFRGMEIIFKETSSGYTQGVNIPMKITINSDNNFLTWTSDETVTMQRCN